MSQCLTPYARPHRQWRASPAVQTITVALICIGLPDQAAPALFPAGHVSLVRSDISRAEGIALWRPSPSYTDEPRLGIVMRVTVPAGDAQAKLRRWALPPCLFYWLSP
jgi:hypothetical protein